MGLLNKLFGGGEPQPDPALVASARQMAQAEVLSEEISALIRETLFDEEMVPAGKSPAALGSDPYIVGFVFGMARETAKTMGEGIDERTSIVVASAASALLFGKLAKPTDPAAPARWELGTVNGKKVADFLHTEPMPESNSMQELWMDYVLYKYPSPAFRASEEYDDIVPQPWF